MKKHTVDLAKIFALDKDNFTELLDSFNKEEYKQIIVDLLMANLTDPNYSSLAEAIPIRLANYNPNEDKEKHGYDGFIGESFDNATKYVEHKPKKTNNKSKKLDGSGGFADYTIEKLNKDKSLGDKLNLMISGWVNGNLIYAYELPQNYSPFMEQIEKRTLKCISNGKRVLPTFGYNHYKNCTSIKLIYLSPDFDNYKDYLTGPFFNFVKNLK